MSRQANSATRKKVAVVGSGCAGIAALWALNRTYHDVYLYEAADRLGGHTNTVQLKTGKYTTAVDTGFIVLNKATCPNFINFLKKIGVETEPTEMTFGLSRDQGLFEWAGNGLGAGNSLRAVFAQKRNIFSPKMWRMLFDIIRFNQFALDLLAQDEDEPVLDEPGHMRKSAASESIGDYLDREGYSDAFKNDYLFPLTAAIWNTSPDKCSQQFPAVTLVRFMWNHHLLTTVAARPQWLTLKNGAKSYIDAVMKGFPPNHLYLSHPVRHMTNDSDGRARLHFENGRSEAFDHVVLATHGDQAHAIIKPSATQMELSILSHFHTSQNEAVLHSDLTHMPRRRKAWSSWNYMTLSSPSTGKANIDKVSLTYNMNMLQHIPTNPFGDVLVTLNPLFQPRRDKTYGRFFYSHPLYTSAAIRAQKLLPRIQNTRNISYAGAWTKYGFHEDGFSSGLQVAQKHLGAKLPFDFVDSTYSRGRRPHLGLFDHVVRLIILLIQVFVVQVLEWLVGARLPKMRVKSAANGSAFHKANGKSR